MNQLKPGYARVGRPVGVIHFGLGAFHRGHQAVYFDEALEKGSGEWGIYGISPRSTLVTDLLRKQDFCYTVNARSGGEQNPRVISSIFDGSIFDLSNAELRKAVHSPELKLITVTVTEKAYQVSNELDSMPNRLLDILHLRFVAGLSGLTIISCDNLPSNGSRLAEVLLASAERRGMTSDFRSWLSEQSFPDSMVDRIVPAITSDAVSQFERDFGYRDESLISTEPYRQWVVAPHSGSDALAELGIDVSPEIARYETLKLRLFNGAHSTTAYFSQLSGIEYVYQAMAIPEWNSFISGLQEELSASFEGPRAIEPQRYGADARARIGNSAVAHRSAQIAMDGSAKLPQRLFRAMNSLGERGLARERIAFAVALWIRFLQSANSVVDPLASELLIRARVANPADAVAGVMRTRGLLDAISEPDWPLIAGALKELSEATPLAAAMRI